jgi:hypothetical protein
MLARSFTVITILVSLSALPACSSDSGTSDPGGAMPEPELSAPANGFQLRTRGTEIGVSEDVEYCEIVKLPGTPDETFYVTGYDIAMTDFSHHLIVSAINPGSEADQTFQEGDIQPCFGAQDLAGFQQTTDVTGAQTPRISYTYPDGVGKVFTGGQKLIFDYHYLNTSTEPVSAKHAINFHTTQADTIDRIAQRLAFVNLTINTPPYSQASFTGECKFDQDVMVGALTRHTHKWGTGFSTWFVGGERDGEHIWTSNHYELDTLHSFEEPLLMKAGTGFRFQCDYDNTTDRALTFGEKATDEMCILFGLWWVVGDDDPVTPQFCIMTSTDTDGVSRGTKQIPGAGVGSN